MPQGWTSHHIHIPIHTLLIMDDVELESTLTGAPASDLRAMLKAMQSDGKTAFTGSSCDHQDSEGKCQGHPIP